MAGLLGFLQPGLGHAYAGKLERGLMLLGLLILARPLSTWLVLEAEPSWLFVGALVILIALHVGSIADAVATARRAPRPYQPRRYNKWYVYVLMLAVAWGFDFLAAERQRRFLQAFRLPSGSMSPTLLIGDWMFVDNRSPAQERVGNATIVTYRRPGDETRYIKRVTGMPGDTLAMRSDTLIRNGRIVDEPYANLSEPAPLEPAASNAMRNWGPFIVPHDHVFILGDNRHSSLDSRHIGPIPISDVLGTALFIYYSYDSESARPFPAITAVRWDRVGRIPR